MAHQTHERHEDQRVGHEPGCQIQTTDAPGESTQNLHVTKLGGRSETAQFEQLREADSLGVARYQKGSNSVGPRTWILME